MSIESTEVLENETTQDSSLQWDRELEEKELEELQSLWKERTGLNEQTIMAAIESLIFMSEKPLSIKKIKASIDEYLPLRIIHEAIESLQAKYESDDHGINIMEVAQGYQFRTKTQYSKVIRALHKVPQISLTPLAIEVLAIVAFKQPISKVEIDDMRGVDSGHLLRGLIDKSILKIVGKSDEAGKSATYGTTDGFLELFNLKELEDLPKMSDLRDLVEDNSIGDIEDIQNLVKSDKDKFVFDEIEELERLKEEIKSISPQTEFIAHLKSNSKKKNVEEDESKTDFDILEEHVSNTDIIEPSEIEEDEALFDDKEKLTEMLDDTLEQMKSKSENEEITDSSEEDEEKFEISDLHAIKENLKTIDS